MITQLLPDQISAFWDIIKYAIEQSVPPTEGDSPDKMNNILAELLSYKKQCWASYTVDGNERKFEAIGLTQIIDDSTSDTKSLLMYCVYGFRNIPMKSWAEALKALSSFAKSKGCDRMLGYTDVPYMIEKTKEFGGEAKYTLVSFDVDRIVQLLNEL